MKLPKFRIKFSLIDLIFVMLLIFGIYLRFYHFDQTYEWGADNVRDFLVAKHIVVYHDFKWIAPWAAGSNNNLANSVFYYYFLAFFYLLSFGNVLIYQLLVAAFSMLVVLFFAYLLGKIFFKEKIMQYGVVLLFCLIPPINYYGRSVFQPYFVIPFLMMSFYYFFAAFKKQSINLLSLAVALYFVTLNFHYSTLIILPWVLGVTFYLQYRIFHKKKTVFYWKDFLLSQFNYPVLIIFLNFYFLSINQLMIRGFYDGSRSFSVFIYKIFVSNPKLYLQNLNSNFDVVISAFTGTNEFIYTKLLLALSVCLFFILFILKKKTFYSVNLFLILLLFPFSFLVVSGDFNLPENYFTVFYIALPLFLISVISVLNDKFKKLSFMVVLIIMLSLSIKQFNGIKYSSNEEVLRKYEITAEIINDDVKRNLEGQNDFFIFVIDGQLDWSSPAYWYYLEKKSDLQLVESSAYKNNIISIFKESANIYLICDNPKVTWDKANEDLCIERFAKNKLLKNYDQIFSKKLDNFSIYRLKLQMSVNRYSVYGLMLTYN